MGMTWTMKCEETIDVYKVLGMQIDLFTNMMYGTNFTYVAQSNLICHES